MKLRTERPVTSGNDERIDRHVARFPMNDELEAVCEQRLDHRGVLLGLRIAFHLCDDVPTVFIDPIGPAGDLETLNAPGVADDVPQRVVSESDATTRARADRGVVAARVVALNRGDFEGWALSAGYD